MHPIYHTTAVVIKSTAIGETNKRVWLFTKDFGYIMVFVQGVRKSTAKLASHIGDYSFINADLVKGKAVWRLVSARIVQAPLAHKARSPLARGYVRTLAAIDRFLIGEGADEQIFEHLQQCAQVVQDSDYEQTDLVVQKNFDTISLWRLLALLGHVAVEPEDEQYALMSLQEAIDTVDESTVKRLIAAVNQAITQSQL